MKNYSRQNTFIIAEAGVNHNGSLKLGKELIDVAASSGADAVKFQTFRADDLVCLDAPKACYQENNVQQTQYEMLKDLELSEQTLHAIYQHCQKKQIKFLSTPFDETSLNLLINDFDMSLIKIASGEITNASLLLKAAQTQRPVILSTGMSFLNEIETALSILAFGYLNPTQINPSLDDCFSVFCSQDGQEILHNKVSLLHCTSEYPTPFEEVNLNVLHNLKSAFNLTVGYSDHTSGYAISLAAVALGATVIEKHFTLDKSLPGPDHQASLEPKELKEMVLGIRQIESALGISTKLPTPSELKNKFVARKSLVALCDIQKGQMYNRSNLGYKRPGTGISSIHFWDWLGRIAERNYKKNELIET